MLKRQRIILGLLAQAAEPIPITKLMKLIFLLRHETVLQDLPSFYDFLPYRLGPFSFTLERELEALRDHEYVMILGERVALCDANADRSRGEVDLLPAATSAAVFRFFRRYGARGQTELASELFRRHPWYAPSGRFSESQSSSASLQRPMKAPPAVYTAGYEGTSVDAFFNRLLRRGIGCLVDVRANPVSRKYGFSKVRLSQLCERLGFEYRHVPSLGISSAARTGLTDFASYQRLLRRYESSTLLQRGVEVEELGRMMSRTPSVLVCVEKDVQCCHRSRLAEALANTTGLEVVHL